MKRTSAAIICLAPLIFQGCATEQQLAAHNRDITETVTSGHRDLSEEHLLIVEKKVEALREQSKVTLRHIEEANKRAEEVYRTALENKRNMEQLGQIALTVGDVATGGRISVITDSIRELIENNRNAVSDNARRTEGVAKRVEEVHLSTLENKRTTDTLSDVALTTSDIAPGGRISVVTEPLSESVDNISNAFAASDKNTALAIKELEGMSTEEIAALIAAWLGATGVGGALGKTGRSRARDDIRELRSEISRSRESESADIAKLRDEIYRSRESDIIAKVKDEVLSLMASPTPRTPTRRNRDSSAT